VAVVAFASEDEAGELEGGKQQENEDRGEEGDTGDAFFLDEGCLLAAACGGIDDGLVALGVA